MSIFSVLKPGASVRTHLFVAACLWTMVGLLLVSIGWTGYTPGSRWLVPLAMLIGAVKSRFVLWRLAHKNIQRILQLHEGTCIGAVYSKQTWMLVLVMIVAGRLLRAFSLPGEIFGTLYVAVGWALFMGSWPIWRKWQGLE